MKQHGRFLLTVHDEINISVPKAKVKEEMQILREAMVSVEFDVPMLSDAGVGPNWGDLKEFKEPPLDLPPWF
jgi:DNA polymerase I-like protein with 3'-5' exonuclease and polymerase domains